MPLIEACVTSLAEVEATLEAGADRIELCRELESGGLTPDLQLIGRVRDACPRPLFILVRPHAQSFRANATVMEKMLQEIEEVRALGVDGIVVAALTHTREIDVVAIRELVSAANDLPVTFHRAFDHVPDRTQALERLIEAGVARVLTSGGAATAWEGRDALRTLVDQAGERISVLAGGAIRAGHVEALLRHTGVTEVHARAAAIPELAWALN